MKKFKELKDLELKQTNGGIAPLVILGPLLLLGVLKGCSKK